MDKIDTEIENGIQTDLFYDAETDRMVVNRTQDVESILEANKRKYNDFGDRHLHRGETFHHAASIPNIVIERWIKEYGTNPLDKGNEALLKRILNDPDNKFLRTSPLNV